MNRIDYLKKIKPIALTAGKKAAIAWKKYDRRQSILKGKTEIVTAVDKKTEKYLVKEITKAFPGYGILGEEYGSNGIKSDYLWIIDPIDGTTNFSIHNPLWSISIGLAYKGKIIFGLIYAPILEELYWAKKGKGSYQNGKKMKLEKNLKPGKEIHAFCHGHGKRDIELSIKYYGEQKRTSLDCRQLGSAAIELAFVAAGRLDSLFIPGARSWDVAAGALIAQEAGALVMNMNGKPWSVNDSDILAASKESSRKLLTTIRKIQK